MSPASCSAVFGAIAYAVVRRIRTSVMVAHTESGWVFAIALPLLLFVLLRIAYNRDAIWPKKARPAD